MPKQAKNSNVSFGKRLAMLRKAAGYTQQGLATVIKVTRRMIAYYEGETDYPPAALLPGLARALMVSVDELLGIVPIEETFKIDSLLRQRMQRFSRLSKPNQQALLKVIDTFLREAS